MEHLEEARLMEHLWDDAPLGDEARDHLLHCESCRQRLAALHMLASEFEIALASRVDDATEARYVALFDAARAETDTESMWSQTVRWIRAQVGFDSRTELAAMGVRSALGSAYRMLFVSDVAEIELMVEPKQGRRRLMGEIMEMDGTPLAPALVELIQRDGAAMVEVESDEFGRFLFDDLAPGNFAMIITPHGGDEAGVTTVEVDHLVIT